ncbi:MAG TPA: hypothetical protein VIV60_18540 [Polyangiaceae bacterium]
MAPAGLGILPEVDTHAYDIEPLPMSQGQGQQSHRQRAAANHHDARRSRSGYSAVRPYKYVGQALPRPRHPNATNASDELDNFSSIIKEDRRFDRHACQKTELTVGRQMLSAAPQRSRE